MTFAEWYLCGLILVPLTVWLAIKCEDDPEEMFINPKANSITYGELFLAIGGWLTLAVFGLIILPITFVALGIIICDLDFWKKEVKFKKKK